MSNARRARWGFDDDVLCCGPTKNKRTRVVKAPSTVLSLDPAKTPDALVFTTPTGTPQRPDNFRKRTWGPALVKARPTDPTIPANFRFHDLRHTCASLMIAKGYSPKAVVTHMGHSQISATFDVYGHLFDDTFDELDDVLEDERAEAHTALARSTMRAAS